MQPRKKDNGAISLYAVSGGQDHSREKIHQLKKKKKKKKKKREKIHFQDHFFFFFLEKEKKKRRSSSPTYCISFAR
jgi:hypothetical protein